MKKRTIESILDKKLHAWADSIADEAVRALVIKDSIITGGSIVSMLLDEKVNDYDIYFRAQSTARAVAQYYVGIHNTSRPEGYPFVEIEENEGRVKILVPSDGVTGDLRMDQDEREDTGAAEAVAEVEKTGEYKPLWISANAITLSDDIQIIVRFTGEPEDIHKNYDFIHCTNYWTSKEGKLVLNQPALEALLCKELRYVGSKYPLCSIIRTRKFIQRGWKINAGQYLKMALQLNELDLLDPAVLEDQLIGVDSAHFIALIDSVKSADPEKVNVAYISEIIDRIF